MFSEEKATLRLLLENNFNDIRYTKQQQWHVLYLTLVAIAGITSIAWGIKSSSDHPFFIESLIKVDWAIGIIGCIFIISYAFDWARYREEKIKLRLSLRIHSEKMRIFDIVLFVILFCLIILVSLYLTTNVMNIALNSLE
jgi:glucose-6-phosphate-specific signal transduction histidine kinase